MMINAKNELLWAVNSEDDFLLFTKKVLCAEINFKASLINEPKSYWLPVDYTIEELNTFLNCLNFEYENDGGGQNLFGIVWLKDGGYLDHAEYDEWWEYHNSPNIPTHLRKDA